MARKRFWNYDQADDTDDIIRWLLGVLNPGRYCGFDAAPFQADMTLRLDHDTGVEQTRADVSQTQIKTGVIMTKQGVIIQEDGVINVAISNGDATHPRYDLIIAQHEYVDTLDGDDVIYSVIEGTPAASPVIPTTSNKLEIVIGVLYIPAGTSALNAGGVIYTPSDNQLLANSKIETIADVELKDLESGHFISYDGAGKWANVPVNSKVKLAKLQMDKRIDESYYAPSSPPSDFPYRAAAHGTMYGFNFDEDFVNFYEFYSFAGLLYPFGYIKDVGRVGSVVEIYVIPGSANFEVKINDLTGAAGYLKIIQGDGTEVISNVTVSEGETARFRKTRFGWVFNKL